MRCQEIDYQIYGNDLQVVEVELDPGETVIAEAGAMNWMEDHISFESKMGDGSKADEGLMGKLLNVGKRALTGESLFMTHFHNEGRDKRRVAFAAPYPGHIIPIDMAQIGEELICQKDAFLCAALGTELSIAFNRRLGSGFFGGEGHVIQERQNSLFEGDREVDAGEPEDPNCGGHLVCILWMDIKGHIDPVDAVFLKQDRVHLWRQRMANGMPHQREYTGVSCDADGKPMAWGLAHRCNTSRAFWTSAVICAIRASADSNCLSGRIR